MSADREQRLLIQSRALIFKYGIKSLTMDDISQQLGISKKTLYQYFENKADLVQKVMLFTIRAHRESCCEVQEKDINAIEELLKIYQSTAFITKQLNPSLNFELKKYYPESWNLLEKHKTEFIYNSLVNNIQKGIESGLYRADLNIPIIAKLYTMRVLEITNTEIFPPEEFPAALVLKEMFIYHIRGIASKNGLEFLEEKLKIDL